MSVRLRCAFASLLLAAPALAAAAGPEAYRLDPVHTRVMFAISHAGFSDAIGTVSGSTGRLWFDRDDWRSARLEVEVPLTRLDLGDAKWNTAALAANLLDGERHPQARFVSRTVEPLAADRANVCGELTLRGATAPLCLEVRLNALKRHPLPPFRRTAGFSATATLSRAAFGIDAWKSVIGDAVTLRIEAEAVRDGSHDATAETGLPASQSTAAESTAPESAAPAPASSSREESAHAPAPIAEPSTEPSDAAPTEPIPEPVP